MGADERLLGLIGDTAELLDIDDFRVGLIRAVRHAVPADWVTLNDIGPDPSSITVISEPPADPRLFGVFTELALQNPLIGHYARTRDGRATRMSDLISREAYRALEIYERVYAPMRVEYQLAFTLPHVRDRILGVAMSREHEDFSDAEVNLIETARPFLIQAFRNATRYSELLAVPDRAPCGPTLPNLGALQGLGLSRRQAEALRLLCTGAGEAEIAQKLGISPRTLQKHLQLCYRALGVSSRSEAAAVGWSVGRASR